MKIEEAVRLEPGTELVLSNALFRKRQALRENFRFVGFLEAKRDERRKMEINGKWYQTNMFKFPLIQVETNGETFTCCAMYFDRLPKSKS